VFTKLSVFTNVGNVEGTDGVTRRHTLKGKIYVSKVELVRLFLNNIVPTYTQHRAVDYHQKTAIKELKNKLTMNDLVIHIDFAENYSCKYASEAQIIHFGGNIDHVFLHTVVCTLPF